jgi:hypothetical protein
VRKVKRAGGIPPPLIAMRDEENPAAGEFALVQAGDSSKIILRVSRVLFEAFTRIQFPQQGCISRDRQELLPPSKVDGGLTDPRVCGPLSLEEMRAQRRRALRLVLVDEGWRILDAWYGDDCTHWWASPNVSVVLTEVRLHPSAMQAVEGRSSQFGGVTKET